MILVLNTLAFYLISTSKLYSKIVTVVLLKIELIFSNKTELIKLQIV